MTANAPALRDRNRSTGNLTYLRYELVRLVRNRQNFVFSLIFPIVLYFTIAGSQRHTKIGALPFPTYYMAGMIGFGTIGAVLAGGARIAFERELGWTRQLRISPLAPSSYLRIKILTSYLMAAITIGLLFVSGAILGVRMPAGRWFEIAGLVLIALIPFAAAGIMLGHLIKSDTMGPVMGFSMSGFSILGGAFGPIFQHGIGRQITELIPSYWLVRAGHTALGGAGWTAEGWIVVAVWSAVAVYGAVWAYRRDNGRV